MLVLNSQYLFSIFCSLVYGFIQVVFFYTFHILLSQVFVLSLVCYYKVSVHMVILILFKYHSVFDILHISITNSCHGH